jgi:RNA polymerase sigma factor (sigma-70 family)
MAVGQLSTFVQQLRCLLNRGATEATDESLLESFLKQRDETAFESLVRRHGPMVLGVCRRILGNVDDAEDAFQATFLVLVRKAASIRPQSMVGNWLYGVAGRTALDARRAAAKRRAKEAAVLPRTQRPDDDRADLRAVLDEELQRLPPRWRAVIVMSDLEGKTRTEVAQHLGLPEGTVASRLARARARLAKRLARHGLAVSGASVGAILSDGAASASVPTSLVASTVKAANLLAAGQAAAGVIPAQVSALVEGALKTMLYDKLLKGTAILLLVVAFGTGAGLALSHGVGTETADGLATPAGRTTSQAKADAPAADGVGAGKETPLQKEWKRLAGTWKAVAYESDGEKIEGEAFNKSEVAGDVLTIQEGKWIVRSKKEGGQLEASLKIDPTANPKTMDRTVRLEGEAQVGRSICELDGDTLRICANFEGAQVPPKSFTAKGSYVLVYKRQKGSGKDR